MTTASPDDTTLDALAAQVRGHPPLPLARVADLLARIRDQHDSAAVEELVAHHLAAVLTSALRHRAADAAVDVDDLYQEGSIAMIAAVMEYAGGDGDPAGLRSHLEGAIERRLDEVVAEARRLREQDEAFVRDSRLVDGVEIELRRRLGRDPTPSEIAELLTWEEDRVRLAMSLLNEARAIHDESLLPYLDDIENEG